MNSNITIGIDIDGTLTVPDFWVKPLNQYFKKDYIYGQSDYYDWRQIYNLNNEEFMKYYQIHGPDLHLNADIRPYAAKIVQSWHNYYQICYLTARQKFLTNATEKWLKEHQLPGDFFVLGSHYKLSKAQELNCSIFIEDNYQVACQLAEGGIHVVLLDCVYNRKLLPEKLVTRVRDWQEVSFAVTNIIDSL